MRQLLHRVRVIERIDSMISFTFSNSGHYLYYYLLLTLPIRDFQPIRDENIQPDLISIAVFSNNLCNLQFRYDTLFAVKLVLKKERNAYLTKDILIFGANEFLLSPYTNELDPHKIGMSSNLLFRQMTFAAKRVVFLSFNY